MPTDLNVRFNKDKAFLIEQTQEYLKNPYSVKPLGTDRDKIKEAIEEGSFSEALQGLEILREAKTGITLTKISAGKNGESPIIIRDARNAKDPRSLGTEAFEMQYLNAIRAGIDLAKIENKPELEEKLKSETRKFINSFNILNMNESQENLSANIKTEINDIAKLLGQNGIKDAHKKLNVAKDFQNFNDEHYNIVTISNIKDNKQ